MRISLKSARVNKGFTQENVAKALQVNKKTVSSWENGKTMPNAKMIEPLCALLGVSYDTIKWKV